MASPVQDRVTNLPVKKARINWDRLKSGTAALMVAGAAGTASAAAVEPVQTLAPPHSPQQTPKKVYAASIEPFVMFTPTISNHAKLVSAILKNSSVKESGADVQIDMFDESGSFVPVPPGKGVILAESVFPDGTLKPRLHYRPDQSQSLQKILAREDVLNESAAPFLKADLATTPLDVKAMGEFWDRTKTIIVEAAGNGHDNDKYLVPDAALANRNLIVVGAVKPEYQTGPNGKKIEVQKAAEYSSRIGPSFVAENPFDRGFTTSYYKSAPEVRAESIETYGGRMPDGAEGCLPPPLNPPEWPKNKKVSLQVLACLQSVIEKESDGNGFPRTGPDGTSFTAPNAAGGMLANVMSRRPGLTPVDYVAAALMSAKPLTGDPDLIYRPNGSGVALYDVTQKTGFGLGTHEQMDATVSAIQLLQKERPDLKSEPNRVGSGLVALAYPEHSEKIGRNTYNSYVIKIDDDSTAIRTILEIKLKGQFDPCRISDSGSALAEFTGDATPNIELTTPDGTKLPLATTPASGKDPTIYASTNAFYGNHAKGNWILTIRNEFADAASLTVAGVKRNGLIDAFITQERQRSSARVTLSPSP